MTSTSVHGRDVPRRWDQVAAVAVGGVLGALARHALHQGVPGTPGGWPWATLGANLLGSFWVAVLMVTLASMSSPHPLLRPFLGPGVLGGFTTFSAYALETGELVTEGRPGLAAAYVVVTTAGSLLAVRAGAVLTRAASGRRGPGAVGP